MFFVPIFFLRRSFWFPVPTFSNEANTIFIFWEFRRVLLEEHFWWPVSTPWGKFRGSGHIQSGGGRLGLAAAQVVPPLGWGVVMLEWAEQFGASQLAANVCAASMDEQEPWKLLITMIAVRIPIVFWVFQSNIQDSGQIRTESALPFIINHFSSIRTSQYLGKFKNYCYCLHICLLISPPP